MCWKIEEYCNRFNFTLFEDTSKNYDKTVNYFQKFKPKGIVIYDSYNNPFFKNSDVVFE